MPEYDLISQAEIKRLFEEYNIKILIEKNYFGCEELKKKCNYSAKKAKRSKKRLDRSFLKKC